MVRTSRNEFHPDYVSPPGETLLDVIEERGISQAELAERTGRPKKTINEIIKGKASITAETALQLELVLGAPADFWNQREKDFRAYLAKKDEDSRLAGWHDWIKEFPVRQMIKLGWLPDVSTRADKVRALLRFFCVASPEQWHEVHAAPQAAFRKSKAFKTDTPALSAWLTRGAQLAAQVECHPFDKADFERALAEARALTREPPRDAWRTLQRRCAAAGVAVVLVPELKNCRASGATRWLGRDKAVVQLSRRYKTDDHVWFTFFHEAAHILLHGRRAVFVEARSGGAPPEVEDALKAQEAAANRYAAEILLPKEQLRRLAATSALSKAAITEFADSVGIAPGIVVGRLQHEGILPFAHFNDLKRAVEWPDDP